MSAATYFAFVLIGIAAQEFLGQSIGTFGGSLRESQTTGTLELMLLGRSRLVYAAAVVDAVAARLGRHRCARVPRSRGRV